MVKRYLIGYGLMLFCVLCESKASSLFNSNRDFLASLNPEVLASKSFKNEEKDENKIKNEKLDEEYMDIKEKLLGSIVVLSLSRNGLTFSKNVERVTKYFKEITIFLEKNKEFFNENAQKSISLLKNFVDESFSKEDENFYSFLEKLCEKKDRFFDVFENVNIDKQGEINNTLEFLKQIFSRNKKNEVGDLTFNVEYNSKYKFFKILISSNDNNKIKKDLIKDFCIKFIGKDGKNIEFRKYNEAKTTVKVNDDENKLVNIMGKNIKNNFSLRICGEYEIKDIKVIIYNVNNNEEITFDNF